MSRDMQVIHVFQEDDPGWQAEHLEYWFGFPDPASQVARDDSRVLCYCGASLVPLRRNVKDSSDILVGAIWHRMSFDPVMWVPPEMEQHFNPDWRDVPGDDDEEPFFYEDHDE
jgi:hypothetical protein